MDFFKDEIKIINNDLYKYLNIYRHFCISLNEIYPEFKYFISETLNKIKDLLKELRAKSEIQLPSLPPEHIYVFPNAWFITPNGYLYNTGGPDGHQNGNLHNSFIFACDRIKLGLPIPKKIGCYEQIKSIEAREFETVIAPASQFFCHFIQPIQPAAQTLRVTLPLSVLRQRTIFF